MNDLTFDDIAMPVSFYEETGIWGYMVNPDHKDFDAIRKALKADPDEKYFFIYSKNVLFSYIYKIYPYQFLDDMASYFNPDESIPRNANPKHYKMIDSKVKPYFDQIMEKHMNHYYSLVLDDGTVVLSTKEKDG